MFFVRVSEMLLSYLGNKHDCKIVADNDLKHPSLSKLKSINTDYQHTGTGLSVKIMKTKKAPLTSDIITMDEEGAIQTDMKIVL